MKFEDAKPGTLADIQVGDQLRVRGAKSEDGATIQADEVVSGSFRNLAGTIATINAAGGTLTLKDLTTKKTMTVMVTANSDLRKLPPEMAARFAARAKGGAGGCSGRCSKWWRADFDAERCRRWGPRAWWWAVLVGWAEQGGLWAVIVADVSATAWRHACRVEGGRCGDGCGVGVRAGQR